MGRNFQQELGLFEVLSKKFPVFLFRTHVTNSSCAHEKTLNICGKCATTASTTLKFCGWHLLHNQVKRSLSSTVLCNWDYRYQGFVNGLHYLMTHLKTDFAQVQASFYESFLIPYLEYILSMIKSPYVCLHARTR